MRTLLTSGVIPFTFIIYLITFLTKIGAFIYNNGFALTANQFINKIFLKLFAAKKCLNNAKTIT